MLNDQPGPTVLSVPELERRVEALEKECRELKLECRALSGALKAAVGDFNDERTRRLAAERELDRRIVGNIRLGPRAQTDEEVAAQVKRFAESVVVTPVGEKETTDPTDPRLGHGNEDTQHPQVEEIVVGTEDRREVS